LALSDRYGVYALVFDRGKEIKYGGGVESAWGGVYMIIEVVGARD
jgi:hypothetical protein